MEIKIIAGIEYIKLNTYKKITEEIAEVSFIWVKRQDLIDAVNTSSANKPGADKPDMA